MDTSQAFFFLGLSPSASTEELDAAFRRLALQYHPDHNTHRQEWSHRMTVLLFQAYETAAHHLAEEAKKQATQVEERRQAQNEKIFSENFSSARGLLLEALHIYYSYGLENIRLRSDGSLHLRFARAKHLLEKGLARFSSLENMNGPPDLRHYASLYGDFALAFRHNTGITRIFIPDGSINHKAYRHYHRGEVILDGLIKSKFFPEDFPSIGQNPKSQIICERELFRVITDYRLSVWMPEAVIKLSLLAGFSQLAHYEAGIR